MPTLDHVSRPMVPNVNPMTIDLPASSAPSAPPRDLPPFSEPAPTTFNPSPASSVESIDENGLPIRHPSPPSSSAVAPMGANASSPSAAVMLQPTPIVTVPSSTSTPVPAPHVTTTSSLASSPQRPPPFSRPAKATATEDILSPFQHRPSKFGMGQKKPMPSLCAPARSCPALPDLDFSHLPTGPSKLTHRGSMQPNGSALDCMITNSGGGGRGAGITASLPHHLLSPRSKLSALSATLSMVRPRLFIGGRHTAHDLTQLRRNGVTHIVNLAYPAVPNYHANDGIEYLALPLRDDPREVGIDAALLSAAAFATRARVGNNSHHHHHRHHSLHNRSSGSMVDGRESDGTGGGDNGGGAIGDAMDIDADELGGGLTTGEMRKNSNISPSSKSDGVRSKSSAGGGGVAFVCAQGVSRSAACLLATLMLDEGLTADAALRAARGARPIVAPNVGFLDALNRLEQRMRCGRTRDAAFRMVAVGDAWIPDLRVSEPLLPNANTSYGGNSNIRSSKVYSGNEKNKVVDGQRTKYVGCTDSGGGSGVGGGGGKAVSDTDVVVLERRGRGGVAVWVGRMASAGARRAGEEFARFLAEKQRIDAERFGGRSVGVGRLSFCRQGEMADVDGEVIAALAG